VACRRLTRSVAVLALAGGLVALAPWRLASVPPAAAQGQGPVVIEINPWGERRLPVAITDFVNDSPVVASAAGNVGAPRDDKGIGKRLAQVIAQDLEFSGLFRVLDPAGFLEDPAKRAVTLQQIHFPDWTAAGAEALIKGRYRLDGNTVRVEAFLYDPVQAKQLTGREYTADALQERRVAHKFAGEVVQAFTQEPGVFDTRIAFVSNRSGSKEVYVMDYDGHNVRRVTAEDTINLVPSWSPDGRALSLVSFRERNPDLYILRLQDSFLQRLKLPFPWRGSFNGGAWSPKGSLFAFGVSREGNSDIYLMNADGSGLKQLTNHFAQDVAPSFSPDGRQLVFMSDRSGNPNLYVVDIRGENPRRITFEGRYNGSPAWSPKGDRIAFACLNDRGRFDICTVKPDGTELARLTSEGSNDSPTWSPDGRFLAYESNRDGPRRLYVMYANGQNARRLTPVGLGGQGDDTAPSWSPRPID
jgi:TolB protein